VTFPEKPQWGGKAEPDGILQEPFQTLDEWAAMEQYVQHIWLFSYSSVGGLERLEQAQHRCEPVSSMTLSLHL